ncbi:hypothetical protein [Phaeobacter inhibens]|uniref:hypothetical protein n=1 Tax=Phaeobacter inhibens TaxID=221822 RepID=UPI0021A440A2|nr:hypothetical protein [Phaeobacter inhibens]UWS06755.1 hypothetical protein K4K98_10840 [Phaeobacter inhibens]
MARAYDVGFEKTASAMQKQLDALTGVDKASKAASASAKAWAGQLDLQSKSFDRLRASLDPVYASSKQYERVVEQVDAAVRSGIISQSEANRVLEQASTKYFGLVPAAQQVAKAKELVARSSDRARQGYEQTRASLDPLYASSKRYEAVVKQMANSVRIGAVSQSEANKVLGLASERYLGAARSMKGATAPARGFLGLFSKERSNDLRQVALQLSQIGQHGAVTGDYLHAASIQAADIGLSFGMIGVAVGTAISVLGPMALSLIDGTNATSAFDDALKELEASLTSVDKQITSLSDEFVEFRSALSGADADVRKLAEAQARMGFRELADDAAELHMVLSDMYSTNGWLNVSRVERLSASFGDLGGEVRSVAADLDAVGKANTLEGQINAVTHLREHFAKVAGSIKDMTASEIEFYGLVVDTEAALRRVLRRQELLEEAVSGANQALVNQYQLYGETRLEAEGLAREIGRAEANALALAGVDITTGISSAALEAANLAANLGISLNAAINLANIQSSKEYSGRGSDPRDWMEEGAESAYELKLGYESVDEVIKSLTKTRRKGTSAGKKATNQLKKEADAVRASLDPMAAYNRELVELAKLQGLLSKDEMAKAVANLNVELADSLPLVGDLTDTLTEGLFNGFEGTLKDIGQTFKNWLIQMISTAAKNRIMLSLGFGGSLAGTAASAAGGLGGGSGILGGGGGGLINIGANLLGGGQIAQGIMSGLGGVFTGGGLTSSFANLGGLVSGASSGLGAFGAALPALGIIAGGIAILSKGLSREYDGRAVRGSLGPDGFDGFEFDFWDGGFLRGDKQVNHTARPEIQSMLDDGALAVRSSVEEMAAALGLASTAIDDFTADGFTIWLTGPNAGSEEQIAKAFEDQLTRLGDGMADLVLETEDYAKAGEGAYDTLTRLGGSLITANEGFGLLNQSLFEGSLKAAESASALMDAFGGVEQFTVSVGSYFELMFTDVERLAKQQQYAQEALDKAAEQLNLTLPTTHEAFRNLVAGLDRTTEEGREAYVTLIGLSDEFSVVHGTAQQAADALNGVGDALSQAEAEARRLKEQNIRDALAELTGAIKEAVDEMQGRLGIISDRLKLRLKRLQISVGADRDAITASHTALMDQLEGRLGTLEGAAEKSRQLFETLDDAIRDRRRIDAEGREVERRRALMYVQNGGSDPDRLSDALSVLGEDNSADFSNYADYLADYYRTSNIVSERGDAAQTEMTAADMAVSALEQQITLAQSQHEAEMQRLDQILADGQRTYELAMGEYIAAINVENAVTQLNHTAERYTLVSERIETRMEELETIRLNMEQMVAATLDPSAGLPSISEGVFNVVGAVNALGGSIGQMAAGVAAVASAQKEANRIAQIKALERTQVVNSRPGAARAAGENGTIGGALEAVGEIRALREEMAGYLGPISKATGATERSLKRVERDGLTTKGAA